MRFRFGGCVLDTGIRELRRNDRVVGLKPKGFRLLEVLLERRPSAVSQEELREILWPDVENGGTTVARLVSEVRSAIGDSGDDGDLIRTVHRFGYAFCGGAQQDAATAHAASPRPAYAVQWDRQVLPLIEGENIIGRSEDAQITIASPEVSRRHARIIVEGKAVTIEDLGSRNGTFVGVQRLSDVRYLKHRDRIALGSAQLIFYSAAEEETIDSPVV